MVPLGEVRILDGVREGAQGVTDSKPWILGLSGKAAFGNHLGCKRQTVMCPSQLPRFGGVVFYHLYNNPPKTLDKIGRYVYNIC